MQTKVNRFLEKFNSSPRLRIGIFAAAGLTVLLLMLSECLPAVRDSAGPDETITQEEYLSELENSITRLVNTIDGVGRVSVMVTLESGTRYVYAVEETQDTDRTNQSDATRKTDNLSRKYIVVRDRDGGEAVVPQTTLLPEVRGVVVVCDGGDSAPVRARVTEAVAVALHLDYNQIFVTKMSQQ